MEMITVFLQRKGVTYLRPWLPAGLMAVACLIIFISSCATIGHEFPASRVPEIQIGKTTQAEIQTLFGSPWRVGIEDGQRTWTYGRYHYRIFSEASTKDLVIRFDAKNIVISYTFNTTDQ
jgi:hypothetical protein